MRFDPVSVHFGVSQPPLESYLGFFSDSISNIFSAIIFRVAYTVAYAGLFLFQHLLRICAWLDFLSYFSHLFNKLFTHNSLCPRNWVVISNLYLHSDQSCHLFTICLPAFWDFLYPLTEFGTNVQMPESDQNLKNEDLDIPHPKGTWTNCRENLKNIYIRSFQPLRKVVRMFQNNPRATETQPCLS